MKPFLTVLCCCLILSSALILEGCNGQGFSSAERIISSGWADVSNEDSEGQEPLYCYKTIGNVDCYTTPDPRRKKQLVATYPQKNTARPIGVKKIIKFLTQDEKDHAAIQEQDLDKVRYEAPLFEKDMPQHSGHPWQASQKNQNNQKPFNIK